MKGFDCNGFYGYWPFRRFYHGRLEDLMEVQRENGITGGCVSSLQSIFYNDPMEAEEELAEALKGTSFRQLIGINPTLPAAFASVREAVSRFDAVGVRIYPGYHQYRLDDPAVDALCGLLEELDIPLVVTMRVEDERLCYLMTPRTVTAEEQQALPARFPRVKMLYTGLQSYEVTALAETFARNDNLFAETSFFKSPCDVFERVVDAVPADRILYGSGYPVNCLKSTWIALERTDISEEDRLRIASGNSEKFFR